MSRQESCHASTVQQTGKHRRRKLAWHQETPPEAVWSTRGSQTATKQVDMQLSSAAADLTDVSSRKWSCKLHQSRQISSGVEGLLCAGHLAGPSRGRLGRQEACPEAVLGARRPVRRPSWASGGPSEGRLSRQEAGNVGVLFFLSFKSRL